jgi:hypothetical protein
MNESMEPMGVRDILGSPTPFTVVNILPRMFSALIPIGQLKVRDWIEFGFYQFNHPCRVGNGCVMCFTPIHMCSLYDDIHGLNLSIL